MNAKQKLLGALINSAASLEVSDEFLLSVLREARQKTDRAIESWGTEEFEKNADQAIFSLDDVGVATCPLYVNGSHTCRTLFERAYGKAPVEDAE